MRLIFKLLDFIALLIISLSLNSQNIDTNKTITANKKQLVYQFNIHQDIGPAIWRQTQQAFDEANELNADIIIINMNTYGGLVNDADSIRTKILNCKIPVYVFINNNAASAGALISIACDRIYMRKGANIGAATVVDQSGQPVPDKYQSFMRSTMRSTAEAHGYDTLINNNDTIKKWHRDPRIAEAMVDPMIFIEGIIDSGKVLTFTTSEAIKHGYCEGTAENIQEVIDMAGITNYEIKQYEASAIESIIAFFVNPIIHGLLIMIIIGGIYFELQTPGIGFPIGAAIIATVLYFAPLYLEGLAENWEIIIFFIGLILLLLEIFVIPGFGVAGVTGIIFVVMGLSLSMIDNVVFDFRNPEIAVKTILKSLTITSISIAVSFVLSIYLSKEIFTSKKLKIALYSTQEANEGFVGIDLKQKTLIGKTGVVVTMLRLSGKVEIDGEIYDAMSLTSFINKGDKVKVIRDEAGQVYVRKI